MLRYLRVSNLAVVREAALELDDGLTVLTGETGAGKSILVDALTLLLGARASADLVRTGAESAAVEGIFRVANNPAALAALEELGVEPEDGEVVVRREIAAEGRGRAFLGGALQPLAAVRRLGALLADVYGQHEHVRLLDTPSHLDLLDHFAGLHGERAALLEAARALREARAELARLAGEAAERARRADFLRFEIGEIEAARPEPGEQEALAQERHVLAHRARIVELAEAGYQALYESDGAVLDRLGEVHRDLVELAGCDRGLEALPREVEAARVALAEVARALRDRARSGPVDPARLEWVEGRLAVLERLARKYGGSIPEALTFGERARRELAALEDCGARRAELEAAEARAIDRWRGAAAATSRRRQEAAPLLARRVERELDELAMEGASFRVAFEAAREGSACGAETASFEFSANPGEEPRPLARVASGGELARLLLALRTAAGDPDPSRIAVFHGLEAGLVGRVTVLDEVDAGIGGRVAYVLARKLVRLARGRQVLCVTHLAPVAAAARHHVAVRKRERQGRTEVRLERLDRAGRLAELGRMIGGDAPSAAVLRHAGELLAAGHGEGA